MSSPIPHAPHGVARTPIRVTAESQDVSATAPLTADVPPGAHVRLAADSLRSVTGGFDPAHLVLDTGELGIDACVEAIVARLPATTTTSASVHA